MSNKEYNLNKDPNNKKIAGYIIMIILGLCIFGWLLFNVIRFGILPFDDPVREFFYEMRHPGLNTLTELITYTGEWPFVTAMCLLLLIYPKTRYAYGIPVSAVAILTQIVEKTIKHIVQRERPDVSLHLIEQGGYSFPSGHSITSMAVYLLLFILILAYMKKGGAKNALLVATLVLAFFVGMTRIYLGVHFPSDVLAGWSLAWVCICVVLLVKEHTKLGQKYMTPRETE